MGCTDIVNITSYKLLTHKLFTHSAMTDLQIVELGGGTEKTLWQLCQLIVVEIPGEVRDHRSVKLCIRHRPDWQVEVSLPTKHSTPTAVQRKTLP